MNAAMRQIMNSGDVQKNMERLGASVGIDFSDQDWKKASEEFKGHILEGLSSFFDHITIEKNASGEYRISLDPVKAINEFSKLAADESMKFTEKDMQEMADFMSKSGFQMTAADGKIVTEFMSAKKFRSELLE
jgi:hypothetical protein